MRHFHFDRRLVRYQKLSSLAELEALEFRYENTIYLVPKEEPAANGAPAENKYAEYIWMPNESDPTPPSEDRKGFVREISARRVLNPFSVKGVVHGVKPIPVDRTKGHWELLGDSEKSDLERIERLLGEEVARATREEGVLREGLADESRRAAEAEGALRQAVEAEADRAARAEDGLAQSVADERQRAVEAEGAISGRLAEEAQTARAAEQALQSSLDDEAARAALVEQGLRTDLGTNYGEGPSAFERINSLETDMGSRSDAERIDIDGGASVFAVLKYFKKNLPAIRYIVLPAGVPLPDAGENPRTLVLQHMGTKVSEKNIFTEYLSVEDTTVEPSVWKWEKLGEAGLDLKGLEDLKEAVGTPDDPADPAGSVFARLKDEAAKRLDGDDATLRAANKHADDADADLKEELEKKIEEKSVYVVNANEAPETKVPTQEMVFSGGYVAMVTDPVTKKVEFYIRENRDNPLMDGAAQVPANGSYFIYGPSSAVSFQLPGGKATGSPFDRCVNMDDTGALTLNVLPAKLRAAKKTDSISVKVYKGGDGEAAYSMDIPAAEVTAAGRTENHITVSAGEVVVVDPSRSDYKELINEGGLTPGSVQFANLKVKVAVSEIVANGGALRVVLTIGGAEHKFDTGVLFLYRTDRSRPVIPAGGFTATVKSSADKYLSGVKYHGPGTVVAATLKDVENTCYYISPTETKATISASELKAGSSTAKVQASDTPDVDYKLNHTADFTMGSGVVFTSTAEPKLTVSCSGQTVNAVSGSATVSRKAGYSGFYSLESSANTFMEDFLDETLRLKEASYSGDTADIPWDSTSTEGLRVLGKAAGQGQLMYPSGATGERNYLRRFSDPAADGENRISTFDITVGGLADSYEGDKVAIYCYDRKGTRFQLNRVVAGGMNVPAKPSGGKWRCAWPATADQPYTRKGIVVEVVMQSAAASKTLGKITLAFNPKD